MIFAPQETSSVVKIGTAEMFWDTAQDRRGRDYIKMEFYIEKAGSDPGQAKFNTSMYDQGYKDILYPSLLAHFETVLSAITEDQKDGKVELGWVAYGYEEWRDRYAKNIEYAKANGKEVKRDNVGEYRPQIALKFHESFASEEEAVKWLEDQGGNVPTSSSSSDEDDVPFDTGSAGEGLSDDQSAAMAVMMMGGHDNYESFKTQIATVFAGKNDEILSSNLVQNAIKEKGW